MPAYFDEPWYALLTERCAGFTRTAIAQQLGISTPTLCQVLNGSGKYGTAEASTERIAERVTHTFGRYECPHLTEQAEAGTRVLITATECRAYAHRPAPTSSPREIQHWQACRQCPHKAFSAPPQPRAIKPRKKHQEAPHG